MKNLLKTAISTLSTQVIDKTDIISTAYVDNEDEISIGLSIKIKTTPAGVEVKTGISFVEKRTKDERLQVVDPAQLQLFDDKPELRVTK